MKKKFVETLFSLVIPGITYSIFIYFDMPVIYRPYVIPSIGINGKKLSNSVESMRNEAITINHYRISRRSSKLEWSIKHSACRIEPPNLQQKQQ